MLTDSLQKNEPEVLISWINEYAYCPRRFYLRVIERQHAENLYMAEGAIEHEHVHDPEIIRRHNLVSVKGLAVSSASCHIYGICDLVECTASKYGAEIPFLGGRYKIVPIEYKHGKVKNSPESELQLCAQAVCLEEMYHTEIDKGYIYYYDSKERFPVSFTKGMRDKVFSTVHLIQEELHSADLIEPYYMKRCRKCSVYEICNPRNNMIHSYMEHLWKENLT